MNTFKGFGTNKAVVILLRVVAAVLVAVVRIVAAVVEPVAEILGIIVYEILVPILAALQKAQDGLWKEPDEELDVSSIIRRTDAGVPARWVDGAPLHAVGLARESLRGGTK